MNLQIPNPRGFARWRERDREKEKKMVDAITLASGHYYVSCRIISPRVLPDLISFVRNSAPSGKACMQHEIQECAMRIYLLRPCKALQGDRCGHFFFVEKRRHKCPRSDENEPCVPSDLCSICVKWTRFSSL